MLAQALAVAATLLSASPEGNRVALRLNRGAAELVWITPRTFRFRRALEGPLPRVEPRQDDPVEFTVDDLPGTVRVRTSVLDVTIRKQGVLVRVKRSDGEPLTADLSEPAPTASGVQWHRESVPGVQFYGLGPRAELSFDLAGKAVAAPYPLLVSTGGYGEYHPGAGPFRFDFTAGDSYRIDAPRVDYYFFYGGTPKEIFQEHNAVRGSLRWQASEGRPASWEVLKDSVLRLAQGAMSGALNPTFDLDAYLNAPEELKQRARQIGSLVTGVRVARTELSGFRKQLESFFNVYTVEGRDFGYPLWHPLPFQFPLDPECAKHADEFMLGDEMLVAPVYEPGGRRSVYLPQGVWTSLDSDEVFQGKRSIEVSGAELPVFARNGTIVPLDSEGGMALHYFPKLGAEFFLLENDANDYTQIHAAPAGDLMRLEIESKVPRDYTWIVHHLDRRKTVAVEKGRFRAVHAAEKLQDNTWFYDTARRMLRVRVRVKAGEDSIVNLSF